MKNIIHFYISKGEKQYVAECVELAIVTQARTLDKLVFNIREATDLHLEIENLKTRRPIPSPIMSLNLELV